jgi:hypothetical protein
MVCVFGIVRFIKLAKKVCFGLTGIDIFENSETRRRKRRRRREGGE